MRERGNISSYDYNGRYSDKGGYSYSGSRDNREERCMRERRD